MAKIVEFLKSLFLRPHYDLLSRNEKPLTLKQLLEDESLKDAPLDLRNTVALMAQEYPNHYCALKEKDGVTSLRAVNPKVIKNG